MKPEIKIIHKNRLSFKNLFDICFIDSKSWDYSKDKYCWASILGGACSPNTRKYNSAYLAIADNGTCVGYLLAYVSNKPKAYHPLLTLIYFLYYFAFLFLKDGRRVLAWRRLYYYQWDVMVKIGKQYLAGKDYNKISEGCSVAVHPQYRKQGIYREFTKKLMDEVKGYLVFQTSTESDYQAHEAMGFKKIFECPFFYPEKHITFIMYGNKFSLKLNEIYHKENNIQEDSTIIILTKEKAISLYNSKFYENMNCEELAKFQIMIDKLCMPFDVFHEALEKYLGHPVFTHEFYFNRNKLIKEIFNGTQIPSYEEIINLIPEKNRMILLTRRTT